MYDAHHRGLNYNIFFVLNGLVDGEEGMLAQKSGTGQPLADGWYYLLEDDVDGDGPYEFREEAEHYAQAAIEDDLESQLEQRVGDFVDRLINEGFTLLQVELAWKVAFEKAANG